MRVRTAAKALIIEQGKLLTLQCQAVFSGKRMEYYTLPGGGQEHGEPLEQSLRRECLEEISVDVEVQHLLFIREYIGKNHGLKEHERMHQIDFIFLCSRLAGQPTIGHVPDSDQVGIAWLELSTLEQVNFFPRDLRHVLSAFSTGDTFPQHARYLGDIG